MIRTSILAAALVVVALGGAAGCGGDRPASPAAAQAVTAQSEAESPEPTVLITEAPPTTEAAPPADPDLVGKQYGYLTGVNTGDRTITFDKVDWITGAAAAKACTADGVTAGEGEKCHDYYIRNHNTKVRIAQLSPDAKLSLQSPNDSLVQLEITLDELADKFQDRLFIITFTDGAASRVSEQFLP